MFWLRNKKNSFSDFALLNKGLHYLAKYGLLTRKPVSVRFATKPDSNQPSQRLRLSYLIWDFGKLHFPLHLGKYVLKLGK